MPWLIFVIATFAPPEIKARLAELWDFPKYEGIHKHGERYFFTRHDGLQNQPKVYLQFGLKGKSRELLDPNSFS